MEWGWGVKRAYIVAVANAIGLTQGRRYFVRRKVLPHEVIIRDDDGHTHTLTNAARGTLWQHYDDGQPKAKPRKAKRRKGAK